MSSISKYADVHGGDRGTVFGFCYPMNVVHLERFRIDLVAILIDHRIAEFLALSSRGRGYEDCCKRDIETNLT